MKTVVLYMNAIETREQAHRYLKKELGFPDYYGENLDALWDLLTEEGKPMQLLIYHSDLLVQNLGEYGRSLLDTMVEAGEENSSLTVTLC